MHAYITTGSTQGIVLPQEPALNRAIRDALSAQLALWAAIGAIETHVNLPSDRAIDESLEELAIGIDRPEDITEEVIARAIAWVCSGAAIA